MGFAVTQARLMVLISRKDDLELEINYINHVRLYIGNEVSKIFNSGKETEPSMLSRIQKLQSVDFRLHQHSVKPEAQLDAVCFTVTSVHAEIHKNIRDAFKLVCPAIDEYHVQLFPRSSNPIHDSQNRNVSDLLSSRPKSNAPFWKSILMTICCPDVQYDFDHLEVESYSKHAKVTKRQSIPLKQMTYQSPYSVRITQQSQLSIGDINDARQGGGRANSGSSTGYISSVFSIESQDRIDAERYPYEEHIGDGMYSTGALPESQTGEAIRPWKLR